MMTSRTCRAFLLTCVVLAVGGDACRERVVFTNVTRGVVTDGFDVYPEERHCEWLIEAPGLAIQLEFQSMATECSYDYLYVYDGHSYESTLLGTFSGNSTPHPVVAVSGYMLIYFFSDRNYPLAGFHATFTASDCAFNCSNHGTCSPGEPVCSCHLGYTGRFCEQSLCPNNCGSHGNCAFTGPSRCECHSGYTGYSCSVPISTAGASSELGEWRELYPDSPTFRPRAGHGGVYVSATHSLYIFGGSDLNVLLDDLVRFDFNASRWVDIRKRSPWPSGRKHHAMAVCNSAIFLYGGELENGRHSDELWVFDVMSESWRQVAASSGVRPLAVSSHTLTNVGDEFLYVYGGRTDDSRFVSTMYRINITDVAAGAARTGQWERVAVRYGRVGPRGLAGHSTVYHAPTRSLIVFGGLRPTSAAYVAATAEMHAFHVDDRTWSELRQAPQYARARRGGDGGEDDDVSDPAPMPRALHTGAVLGGYMAVFGGYAHQHHEEERCYDHSLYLYHLTCHVWVAVRDLLPPGHKQTTGIAGRFSHVATVVNGNTLVVAGGYRGNVLGDLMAYTAPASVARNVFSPGGDHCDAHSQPMTCEKDPECIFCTERPHSPTPGCTHRSLRDQCVGVVAEGTCPGICSALHDCVACTVFGRGASLAPPSLTPPSLTSGPWHSDECSWCVKEAMCQKRGAPENTCLLANATSSKLIGWWGGRSSDVTDTRDCRTKDFPAGVHFIKYHHPANSAQPDSVVILRSAEGLWEYLSGYGDPEIHPEEKYKVVMRGYIHPGHVVNSSQASIYFSSRFAEASLYVSSDQLEQNKELLGSLRRSSFENMEVRRADDRPIFSSSSGGGTPDRKYYFEIVAHGSEHDSGSQGPSVRIKWHFDINSRNREVINYEFLEPYNNGSDCSAHYNCLSCVTDTACGWCPAHNSCLLRMDQSENCSADGAELVLVSNPSECSTCRDLIGCQECLQDDLCMWVGAQGRCTRRRDAAQPVVRNATDCPTPCGRRRSCDECIAVRDECAWCESTRSCFPFAEYVLLHAYGACRSWRDSQSKLACHDCSRHNVSDECLREFRCGWCGNRDNPLIGRCVDGQFKGQEGDLSCSQLIAQVRHISASEEADWFYAQLPDVEECRLGLHDCHGNATCRNTPTGYECHCNRGFVGDGKEFCNKTCYHDCVYGTCAEAPTYACQCDLGWTGSACDENCGCHNHSTCVRGVGMCDACQHWSVGDRCENCLPGSYGNATTEQGCTECHCNSHADPLLGYCDPDNGTCFCTDNTEGVHCSRCAPGFYGDPRHGGTCYRKCEGRLLLGSATSGALGTYSSIASTRAGAGVYCLWIITVYPDLEHLDTTVEDGNSSFAIVLRFDGDLEVACYKHHIYIYDGIPDFLQTGRRPERHYDVTESTLLAAPCGAGGAAPPLVATSGYITVYFEVNEGAFASRSSTHFLDYLETNGFNATFYTLRCPDSHHGDRQCADGVCDCCRGYGGIDCDRYDECGCGEGHTTEGESEGHTSDGEGHTADSEGHTTTSDSNPHLLSVIYDAERLNHSDVLRSALSRMGHTLTLCGDGLAYLYGGYSLDGGPRGDLWRVNLTTNAFSVCDTGSGQKPLPRYYHAAVCDSSKNRLLVYGGILGSGSDVTGSGWHSDVSNELWEFDLSSFAWTQIETSPAGLPALAGHTFTWVAGAEAYVLGGFSQRHYFSSKVYVYNSAAEQWSEKATTGLKPLGLYGHTAVYHPPSSAVYVYGGVEFRVNSTRLSSNLYALDLESGWWSVLPPSTAYTMDFQPVGPYFHSVVSTDEYLLVLGGRTANQQFNSALHLYRYRCNSWMEITPEMLQGVTLPEVVANDAIVTSGGVVYVVGGFDGRSRGTFIRLELPSDACQLVTSRERCAATPGCLACLDERQPTNFVCFSATRNFTCAFGNSSAIIESGPLCDVTAVEGRACEAQQSTCLGCLATWPMYRGHAQSCRWCADCPIGAQCESRASGSHPRTCGGGRACRWVEDAAQCLEAGGEGACREAGDCHACASLPGDCVWASGAGATSVSACQSLSWWRSQNGSSARAGPDTPCPDACGARTSCGECARARGAHAGPTGCVWSVTLDQCMTTAFLPLRCGFGECGLIVEGEEEYCPAPCSTYTSCAACAGAAGCGWCAQAGENGLGTCLAGGLLGPASGQCRDIVSVPGGANTWHYMTCPAENECLNGRHNCSADTHDCVDRRHGYVCHCKSGYEAVTPPASGPGHESPCRPVCAQGCPPEHGTCTRPDVCTCHFGRVGHSCGRECECHGHSDCRDDTAEGLGDCVQCHNNTQGQRCSQCQPLFVGDPQNGVSCQPCFSYCHGHSEICLAAEDLVRLKDSNLPITQDLVAMLTERGPVDQAVCVGCGNNTELDACSQCQDGYFRLAEVALTEPCQPCMCHGHCDTCDKDTGISCSTDPATEKSGCHCHNNTKSPLSCADGSPCYKRQCSECKGGYLGSPVNSHQCYEQMHLDKEYYFEPLLKDRTAFFAVQPKYSNVDIKIIVDVTSGGVDAWLSPFEDSFVVTVDKSTGRHDVTIDERYVSKLEDSDLDGSSSTRRRRRRVSPAAAREDDKHADDAQKVVFKRSPSVSHNNSGDVRSSSYDNKTVKWVETTAKGVVSYLSATHNQTFLLVKNVQNRLLIGLSQEKHQLTTNRFFLVLLGRGDGRSNHTLGSLAFRQDHPRIDLFVFFSVFFASFFMLLAVVVLAWKVKQSVDAQRTRLARKEEMRHMASRPFATCLAYVEARRPAGAGGGGGGGGEAGEGQTAVVVVASRGARSHASHRKSGRRRTVAPLGSEPTGAVASSLASSMASSMASSLRGSGGCKRRTSPGGSLRGGDFFPGAATTATRPPGGAGTARNQVDSGLNVSPIALEPAEDGLAGVATVLLQMPGGSRAPVGLCFGSVLISTRVMYPSLTRTHIQRQGSTSV